MFTPEDDLDTLDLELGRRRRRLQSLERAPFEGRMTDADALDDQIQLERQAIRDLERDRAEMVAERIAEAEGFIQTRGT